LLVILLCILIHYALLYTCIGIVKNVSCRLGWKYCVLYAYSMHTCKVKTTTSKYEGKGQVEVTLRYIYMWSEVTHVYLLLPVPRTTSNYYCSQCILFSIAFFTIPRYLNYFSMSDRSILYFYIFHLKKIKKYLYRFRHKTKSTVSFFFWKYNDWLREINIVRRPRFLCASWLCQCFTDDWCHALR